MAGTDRRKKTRQTSAVCIKEKNGRPADTSPRKVTLAGRRAVPSDEATIDSVQPVRADETVAAEQNVPVERSAVPLIETKQQESAEPAVIALPASTVLAAAPMQVIPVAEPAPKDPTDIELPPTDKKDAESTAKEPWYTPQKWNEISLLRKLIIIGSSALFLFSLLPLFVGIFSPGIIPPACIALFFAACALYWPLIDHCESVWGNILIAVVAVCVLAGVSYLAFVSGKMISASAHTLPEDTSQITVVVLGCKVKGDQPSLMLQARLDKAAEFLLEHPQAHCIVTGGRGPDEDYPEALIMKNYLVSKGVSELRIVMEDKSTSTLENITNADHLAEKYNCYERFLIVTDRFHQYRAMCIANDLGRVSYALNVETVWYLAMQYWFREMAAITRDWIVAA